jgi:hypothetical protein
MSKREGDGTIPADEVIAEADRLAIAAGRKPKRTKGGFGAYGARELIEARDSARRRRRGGAGPNPNATLPLEVESDAEGQGTDNPPDNREG